jgi:hypothetical protein
VKSAVRVVFPAAVGVQEQVADVPDPVETAEQPEIVVPAALKVTKPETLVVAVMVVALL